MDENVLVKNLLPCVKEAGSKIIGIYNSKPNAEKKNDGSPVTIADKEAEKIIIKKIKSLYPSIPIVSEENPESHNLKSLSEFFLVDPLDGTKEFLKFDGKGSFTVNIALIRENEPLIGIVYAPAIKRLFYAGKTFGSFEENKDGRKKIRIRKSDKNKIVAVTSSSHLDQKTKDWLVKNNIARTVSIGLH